MSSRSGDAGLLSQLSGKLRQEDQEIISSLSYIARRRREEEEEEEGRSNGTGRKRKERERERKKA